MVYEMGQSSLDDILITDQLSRRAASQIPLGSPRTPDLKAENDALRALARQLVEQPQAMLKTLVNLAKDLCQAGTAGVSLLETTPSGETIFRWVAIVGELEQHEQGTVPRDFSPCGICLERQSPQLYAHPERYFTDLQVFDPPIIEGLVIPLMAADQPLAAIWILSHDPQRQFDAEDVRVMTSLADFTAAALYNHQIRQAAESAQVELRQREAELSLVTNAVPVLISFIDSEKCYRFNNRTYEKWFGHPAADVYGKPMWEVLGEAAYQTIRSYVEQVLAGQQVTFETEVPYQDGGTRYVQATYIPRFDSQENVEGFVALVGDISERKQAEVALRQSDRRFKSVFNQQFQYMAILTPEGRIIDVNESPLKSTGVKREEVVGQLFWETPWWTPLPDMQATWMTHVAQAVQGGNPITGETYYATGDGTLRFSQYVLTAVKDETDQVVNLIIQASDLTDRKQAEETLRTSEERLRIAQQAAKAGVWDWDIVTNRVTWSEEYYQLYGLDPATTQPSYENWLASITAPDRDRTDQVAREALENQTNLNVEFRIFHPTQGERWITAIGQTFYDANQQPIRMTGIALDITARKQAELEREQLLAREQASKEIAQAANRIKDEFLAVLSHELRSPLNPILGWAKLLQTGNLDETRTKQAVTTIERNAKLQSELIEDLLDVSRILQGKLRLNRVPVDPVSTIQAAMETVRLAAEAKSIQIQTKLDSSVRKILGDPARIQQVIWNLLTNAVKFTSEGGRVEVSLVIGHQSLAQTEQRTEDKGRMTHYAQITVSDTGKGISSDFLPYVFDYFRQEDGATTRRFGGLGLGLAIVRHLVELHGGTIHAESQGEGMGATFTVRLPLMSTQLVTSQSSVESESPLDLTGVKILVVDDDGDTLEYIAFLLEQAGARVTAVGSASEAFALLTQSKPDLLLSDIGMPEMDGYMLLRQIRTLPPEQGGNTPAIALTAYAGEINQQQALVAGFQRHIAKPVEPEELIRAILSLNFSRMSSMQETG